MNIEKMLEVCPIYGEEAHCAVESWQSAIDRFKDLDAVDKINQLNRVINYYIFCYDEPVDENDVDYTWSSALASFCRSAGDANEIATIKMISLLESGFTEDQVRLYRVVLDNENTHTVLGVHVNDADPLILDTITDDVKLLSERSDIHPKYAFNKTHVWINNQLTDKDAKTHVPAWGNCVEKTNAEMY